MTSNFLERFKGKTQQVGKQGVFDIIKDAGSPSDNVIVKTNINFKPQNNIQSKVKASNSQQQQPEIKNNNKIKENSNQPARNTISQNNPKQSLTKNQPKIETKKVVVNQQQNVNNPFYVANPFKLDDQQPDQPYTPKVVLDKLDKQSPKLKQNPSTKQPSKQTLNSIRGGSCDNKKGKQWVKLGGLGANIGGDDWQQKKKKLQKMQQFAEQVKAANNQKLKQRKNESQQPIQRQKQKLPNTRQKALEYCKNIPKPPPKKIEKKQQQVPVQAEKNQNQNQEQKLSQLEIYERRHQELQKLLNNKNS